MRSPACLCLYSTSVWVCASYVTVNGKGWGNRYVLTWASCLTFPTPLQAPRFSCLLEDTVMWGRNDHQCPTLAPLSPTPPSTPPSLGMLWVVSFSALSTLSWSCLLSDGLARAKIRSCYLLVPECWKSVYVQECCCSVVEGRGGAHGCVILSFEEIWLQNC